MGSYDRVYHATYEGKDVAVKYFSAREKEEFEKEVC